MDFPLDQLEATCLRLMDAALGDDRGLQVYLRAHAAKFLRDVRNKCYALRAQARANGEDKYNGLSFKIAFDSENVYLEISHSSGNALPDLPLRRARSNP